MSTFWHMSWILNSIYHSSKIICKINSVQFLDYFSKIVPEKPVSGSRFVLSLQNSFFPFPSLAAWRAVAAFFKNRDKNSSKKWTFNDKRRWTTLNYWPHTSSVPSASRSRRPAPSFSATTATSSARDAAIDSPTVHPANQNLVTQNAW